LVTESKEINNSRLFQCFDPARTIARKEAHLMLPWKFQAHNTKLVAQVPPIN
jgi:hypothetical protein